MFVIIWEFEPAPGCAAEFEAAYGPAGDWARLFGKASGFAGTVLLRSSDHASRYITVDHWRAEGDFRLFQHAYATEYRDLDKRCEGLTAAERKIGEFKIVERAATVPACEV